MAVDGNEKRAKIIAEQAARDEARRAAGNGWVAPKPRVNWAASQPLKPHGRRGRPPTKDR